MIINYCGRIRGYWYVLLLIGVLCSCGETSVKDCSINGEFIPFELRLNRTMDVEIPVTYFPGLKVAYSLNTEETTLLVTNESERFFFIDLARAKVSALKTLGVSKISKVSGALYHNEDSIFFLNEYPPMLMIMDAEGEVFSTRDVGDAPVDDWYNEIDESLYSFNGDLSESRMSLYKGELNLLLASDFYYFPDKSKIQFFGSYDLATSAWKNVSVKAPKEYLEDHLETPDNYLYPFMVRNRNQLLVSFPLSHQLQAYHLEDDKPVFDSLVCAQSKFIDQFAEKVPLGDLSVDRGIDYYVSAPAYGDLNYHSQIGVYSRIVRHEFPILESGTFPNMCSVNYSLQVFSKVYQLLDEIYLEAPKHQWSSAIPTSDGFILLQQCVENIDDSFITLDEFKLVSNP